MREDGDMSKDIFFAGRERERRMYEDLLTGETSWVMLITGLPGIGKSMLLRHLIEQSKSKNISVITLDFAQPWLQVDIFTILEELAKQLKHYCDEYLYQERYEEFRNSLAESREKTLDTNRVFNGIIIDRGEGHEEQEKQIVRASAAYNNSLNEVTNVKNAFYKLVDAMDPLTTNQLVILFDSSEWLYKPGTSQTSRVGRWVMEEFVSDLHTYMQQKRRQCAFVIASRDHLQLGDVREQEIIDHTLSPLEWPEVDAYLQQKGIGMKDSKLRRQVYDITSGHPFCVSLIGEFWRKQQEQEEHAFTIEELHSVQDLNTNALLQDLGKLILDPHSLLYFSDLDRYGVLLRTFNLPMAQAVFPEFFLKGREQEQFDQSVCAPYIVPRQDRYTFHDLLREVQAPYVRVDEAKQWDKYHKRALDYLEQFSPYSLDWYYHALAYDEKWGIVEWHKAVDQTYIDGNRTHLSALLLVAHDKALNLSPTTRAVLAYEQGRYHYSDRQWEEALGSYKRALDFYRDVHDYQGEAKVYMAIADVQRLRNDSDLNKGNNLKAALYYYKQAQAIYVQTKDPLYQAYILQEIGEVQRLRAKWDVAHDKLDAARSELESALESYERALTLFRALGDVQSQAYLHRSMGDALAQRFRDNNNIDDREAALGHYKQAEDLYPLEDNSSILAHICKAEGDLYLARHDWKVALTKYTKAEESYAHAQDQDAKDPLDQAYVCKATGDIHQILHNWDAALEQYEKALNLYQEIGDHSGQAAMNKAKGDVEQARGSWEDALTYYNQALKLYQEMRDSEGVASVHEAIGSVDRGRQNWIGALKHYSQSLDISLQEGNYKKAAYVAQEAGKALRELNEKETAAIQAYFEKARNYYGEGDKAGQAYVSQLMGEVRQADSDLAGAQKDYKEASRLYKEAGRQL